MHATARRNAPSSRRVAAATAQLLRKEGLRERQTGSVVELEDAQTWVASTAAAPREVEAIEAAHENLIAGSTPLAS